MTREEQDLADRQRATHWNKILKHLNFLDGDD